MKAYIAHNRFGFGIPLVGEKPKSPKTWLLAQLAPQPIPRSLRTLESSSSRIKRIKGRKGMKKMERKRWRKEGQRELLVHFWEAYRSKNPFRERVIRFFGNWLTVSARKKSVIPFISSFEREVVRENLNRGFASMLIASAKHPAMLLYLDNVRSAGPDSVKGQRKKVGLNENLAREILELHTVGLAADYTQFDVVSLSKILTGWSIPKRAKEQNGTSFLFREKIHQPGVHTVMGRRYAQKGVRQGEATLKDLAESPFTAQRIAFRLIQHFITDEPPKRLVKKMTMAYLKGGSDIVGMLEVMILDPYSWEPQPRKIKRPDEYLLSSLRMLVPPKKGLGDRVQKQLIGQLRLMGQLPYSPPSPEGWSDNAADWLGGESMLRRLRFAELLSDHFAGQYDAVVLAKHTFGPLLSKETLTMIQRAPSRRFALALLISSPEFQRR